MSDDLNNNFRMVHKLALLEYQDEMAKHRHLDEKVGRHFTILNLLIVAITAGFSQKELREYIFTLTPGLKVLILLGIIALFFSISWGWWWLYRAAKLTALEKISLGNDIEDPLFAQESESSMNWLMYTTYKAALQNNILLNNEKAKYTDRGLIGLTIAALVVALYLLIIFAIIMYKLVS